KKKPEEAIASPPFYNFPADSLPLKDPPMAYIIPGITPRGTLCLSHGDPRTMKSLAALEEVIAAATATPAFGLERFRPDKKYRVLYCSQEDTALMVRPRAKALLKSRGITEWPEGLGFAVYKGIDLDDPRWQEH